MSSKKKLEKEILELDQDIQAGHQKIEALARLIREKHNSLMEFSLSETESYKSSVNTSARSFLHETHEKVVEKIINALDGTGLYTATWQDREWGNLLLPIKNLPPEYIRIGELIPKGVSSTLPTLPAILAFRGHGHVLIFNPRRFAKPGVDLQASILWRIMAFSVPQSYRITLIDTVDRGRSFSTFLNLPDLIRGEKVYCQIREVEDALIRLLNDMEDIIQNRLREIYDTIEEYNAENPKTAIPFHFIAFTSLAEGFSEQALDLLTSISRSGPRAGFYLIGNSYNGEKNEVDKHLNKLIDNSTCIFFESRDQIRWDDPKFAHLPVKSDGLPPRELMDLISSLIQDELKKNTETIELLEFLSSVGNWWTGSSQTGLSVPLGLSEKGKSFQIDIGPQTDSFHVLVGGRIHSGKTNFLHALILSLCTKYSPEEVELYLVDFKEGVEFQDYALFQLPHARAVVIEAEREFGLSILEHLHKQMSDRSELFKTSGVNDVKLETYRQSTGMKTPRIVAIFDEFVRLFEDDDRLADRAYKIMLEIAQRGRAFGIHLILASQRPTISYHNFNAIKSQVSLRVAFKCNDQDDSTLILGERNDRAAYLERLGVACVTYDPNLPNMTDKVNIAHVDKHDRQFVLEKLQELNTHKFSDRRYNPIIFRKDEPVFLDENPAVINALQSSINTSPTIWLGQPIRLATDQFIPLTARENENVLCMGNDENTIFSFFINSLLSIAITNTPDQAEILWFKSANQPSSADVFLDILKELPHNFSVCDPSNDKIFLEELVQRIIRRNEENIVQVRIFNLFNGLHRIRLFRNADDVMGQPIGEILEQILRNGPLVGIHSLCWVDRYDTLRNLRPTTSLDYLEYFRHRIAFHVDKDDSNNLLGIPDASRLGSTDKRAYYRNQAWADLNVDKIKPYELPKPEAVRRIVKTISTKWS